MPDNPKFKWAAKIWAKSNLKEVIADGNWRQLKRQLIERFEGSNACLRHLEKLSKLKFVSKEKLLLSYIEKYANLYKQAHSNSSDSDIIMALRINLPDPVQKALNTLSANWISITNMKDMYQLVRRTKGKILAFEKGQEDEKLMKPEELVRMMTDLKNILKDSQKKKEKATQQVAAAAIIKQAESAHKTKEFSRNNHHQRYQPYSEGRDNRFQKRFANPSHNTRNDSSKHGRDSLQVTVKGNHYNNPYRRNEPRPTTSKDTQVNNAYNQYISKFGEPPGPCYNCKGMHFNKHCPYLNLN